MRHCNRFPDFRINGKSPAVLGRAQIATHTSAYAVRRTSEAFPGVLVCGCHLGDCHYQDGNLKAEKRAEAIKLMLADFGIEEERFRLEWVSAAEGARFGQVVRDFTGQVRKLGVSPYRS